MRLSIAIFLHAWIFSNFFMAAAGGLEPSSNLGEILADVSCSDEAVDLMAALEIRAVPEEGAPIIETLETGRSIYLCSKNGEFRAILYPAEGESVDCSRAGRDQPCSLGWTNVSARYEIRG